MRTPANGRITAALAAVLAAATPLAPAGAQQAQSEQVVVTGSVPADPASRPAQSTFTPAASTATEAVAVTAPTTPAAPATSLPATAPASTEPKAEPNTAAQVPAVVAPAVVAPAAPEVPKAAEAASVAPAPAVIVTPVAPVAPAVAAAPAEIDVRPALVDAIRRHLNALPATSSKTEQAHRAALTAYYQADDVTPLFVTPAGFGERATSASRLIAAADDWGLKAKDFALPASLGKDTSPAELAAGEIKLALAALEYVRQARGGRTVPNDLSHAIDRTPDALAPDAAVRQMAAAPSIEIFLRQQHPRQAQFERLRLAYVALRDGKVAAATEEQPAPEATPQKGTKGKPAAKPAAKVLSREQQLASLVRNMEMWRWMPRELGSFHVIANIPEYTLRVVRNDTVEHEERVIVGKVENQTPMFSDVMETVVFHPFWGVPDSIKVKELLPGLARGANSLARNGLKMQYKGRDIDPSSVNWAQTDIRNVHVYQPPGGANVLGKVKFMFPNKHQVYMHDTPTKHLFSSSQRTFSHGCVRVRNPIKFAEVLLGEDKGWTPAKVASVLDSGPENNNVKLDRKIPVHLVYFTATVADDAKVRYFNDVYGHEKVVQMGLDGKAHLIVKKKEDLGPVRAAAISQLSEGGMSNWWGGGGWSSGGGTASSGNGGASNKQWARDAFRND